MLSPLGVDEASSKAPRFGAEDQAEEARTFHPSASGGLWDAHIIQMQTTVLGQNPAPGFSSGTGKNTE